MDYLLRPLVDSDEPALRRLREACGDADPALALGAAVVPGGADRAAQAAIGPAGELAGAALLARADVRHETRDQLTLWIHPAHRRRGLGARLADWAERTARDWGSGGQAHLLRIDRTTTTLHPDAGVEAWLERRGFSFRLAECELRHDLARLPEAGLPPRRLDVRPWSEETAGLFFATYSEAFRDRPGFPGWPEATWRTAFTGSPEFRADRSMLLTDGEAGAAFLLCEVAEEAGTPVGWVSQMGVTPAWRRRGLGAWLLSRALHGLQEEGMREAALDVNLNNPGALALYERLGFRVRTCRRVYQKGIGESSRTV